MLNYLLCSKTGLIWLRLECLGLNFYRTIREHLSYLRFLLISKGDDIYSDAETQDAKSLHIRNELVGGYKAIFDRRFRLNLEEIPA